MAAASPCRRRLFVLATGLALLAPLTVTACFAPPPAQQTPVDELIARTAEITLAQVVTIDDEGPRLRYHFVVVRRLAGNSPAAFSMEFDRQADSVPGTFDDHSDPAFWKDSAGRLRTDGSRCDLQVDFVIGEHYVVFAGQPLHRKSFERIERMDGAEKDRWLAYVESAIASPERREPTPEQNPGLWSLSPTDPAPPPDPR